MWHAHLARELHRRNARATHSSEDANNPAPQPIKTTPASLLIQGLSFDGEIFSISTKPAMIAIQSTFITPVKNNKVINTQQQPRQNAPCRSPIMNAPAVPS